MKTKNNNLIVILMIVFIGFYSCDRPLEPTDYLDNRIPILGLQGNQDVVFLTQDGDNTYEVFIGISSPTETAVPYTITSDAASTLLDGFTINDDFTVASGELFDSFIINFDYGSIDGGVYKLYLNLEAEGDVQLGGAVQYDLTVVKN